MRKIRSPESPGATLLAWLRCFHERSDPELGLPLSYSRALPVSGSSAASIAAVRLLAGAIAALALGCGAAAAQESPSEVTASQVALYQIGMEAACRHSGRKRGEAPEDVDSACACMARVLKDNASFSEWQHAYYYRAKRLRREESDLLAAHMPKLKACAGEAR